MIITIKDNQKVFSVQVSDDEGNELLTSQTSLVLGMLEYARLTLINDMSFKKVVDSKQESANK